MEADWPDAYRVNRYVRGLGTDLSGNAALAGFKRFPTWMWRNADVLRFVEWLRAHNDTISLDELNIGFYGLDLYSLYISIEVELRRSAIEYASRDGRVGPDEFFFAEQNARLVKNAEEYYRLMFRGRESSWNLRDRHMAHTLEHLVGFLTGQGQRAKIVVWENNSHIGDARDRNGGRRRDQCRPVRARALR